MNGTLPHNAEQERMVLAAVMLAPSIFPEVREVCGEADFYRPHHRALFRLLCELADGQASAAFEVAMGRVVAAPEAYGGVAYVAAMPGSCPSAEVAPTIARQLRALSVRRQVVEEAQRLLESAADPSLDIHTLVARVGEAASRVADGAPSADWVSLGEAAHRAVEEVAERRERYKRGEQVGLSTGWRAVDQVAGFLEPGQQWIIAARPGMGKTSFALNLAEQVAGQGIGVGIFSLEMGVVEMARKPLASKSGVWGSKMQTGELSDHDLAALINLVPRLAQLPIEMQDRTSFPLHLLGPKVKRLKRKFESSGIPMGLLVVDYLQLVSGTKGIPREQQVAEVSRALKALALEERITVVALSQLNRECETRQDKHPQLSDLRESGSIEQDANKVLFLYRGEVYDDGQPGEAEVIIAKNREGQSGVTARLRWDGKTTSFRSFDAHL